MLREATAALGLSSLGSSFDASAQLMRHRPGGPHAQRHRHRPPPPAIFCVSVSPRSNLEEHRGVAVRPS